MYTDMEFTVVFSMHAKYIYSTGVQFLHPFPDRGRRLAARAIQ